MLYIGTVSVLVHSVKFFHAVMYTGVQVRGESLVFTGLLKIAAAFVP